MEIQDIDKKIYMHIRENLLKDINIWLVLIQGYAKPFKTNCKDFLFLIDIFDDYNMKILKYLIIS